MTDIDAGGTAAEAAALERLRGICLAMPEATERPSHGTPTWFVRGKQVFVTYHSGHYSDGRYGFWCAAPEGAQAVLVDNEPELFYRPPYVGGRGWIGVYLDVDEVDWQRVAELVEDSYRIVAPKFLVARLDAAD